MTAIYVMGFVKFPSDIGGKQHSSYFCYLMDGENYQIEKDNEELAQLIPKNLVYEFMKEQMGVEIDKADVLKRFYVDQYETGGTLLLSNEKTRKLAEKHWENTSKDEGDGEMMKKSGPSYFVKNIAKDVLVITGYVGHYYHDVQVNWPEYGPAELRFSKNAQGNVSKKFEDYFGLSRKQEVVVRTEQRDFFGQDAMKERDERSSRQEQTPKY